MIDCMEGIGNETIRRNNRMQEMKIQNVQIIEHMLRAKKIGYWKVPMAKRKRRGGGAIQKMAQNVKAVHLPELSGEDFQ